MAKTSYLAPFLAPNCGPRCPNTAQRKPQRQKTFFTARTPQPRQTEHQAQDGADTDSDAEQAGTTGKHTDTLLTQQLLQTMLDAGVSRMQTTVTAAKADMKRNLTDLGTRTSQLENNTKGPQHRPKRNGGTHRPAEGKAVWSRIQNHGHGRQFPP
ncbi:Hypothetical predicted protein [Pelobates cultripes]|uniref:Uncharacterized protein n=1 Tax=Pelobates cultripes TaxID=61616 RepID=A0AAD1WAN7_PELCU|nr:Hypothetical predicted protein [Pelobates cultripes]